MTTKKTATKKATKAPAKKTTPKTAEVVVDPQASGSFSYTMDLATRDEAISAFIHATNTPGKTLIARADQAPNVYTLRRPTGIIELDLGIGGGWPAGGVSMVSGPDNSGKSWLVFKTMAMQQRIYGDACRLGYGMSEGQFPFDQAINAGLKIAVPDSVIAQWNMWRAQRRMPAFSDEEIAKLKEQVGLFHIFVAPTGEELLQVLLNAVNTNAYSVLGCDSINGLLPNADAPKELDKVNKKAAHAAMIDNFFKHYIPITTNLDRANPTTLLFTQQVRANQERANMPSNMQKFVKPWSVSGAYAAKHYKLIDLILDDRPLKKGEREDRHCVGKVVTWMLDKGKAGTHDNKSGEYVYYYHIPGTDDVGDLLASGLKRGIIGKFGSKWGVVRPDTGEILPDFLAPSQKAMKKMIESDFDFEMCLRREVLASVGIQCLYE